MKIKDLLTNKRGQWAERIAEDYLVKSGLEFVTRNYAFQRGEIDLIMRDKNALIFVEVRYRKSEHFGGGIESIDFKKQKKLHMTAQHYLQHNDRFQEHPCRFDAVLISGEASQPSINWIRDAF